MATWHVGTTIGGPEVWGYAWVVEQLRRGVCEAFRFPLDEDPPGWAAAVNQVSERLIGSEGPQAIELSSDNTVVSPFVMPTAEEQNAAHAKAHEAGNLQRLQDEIDTRVMDAFIASEVERRITPRVEQ